MSEQHGNERQDVEDVEEDVEGHRRVTGRLAPEEGGEEDVEGHRLVAPRVQPPRDRDIER